MPNLPEIIKHKGKLFREAGFSFADCKGYKYKKERILVDPTGEVWRHYTLEDGQIRGF